MRKQMEGDNRQRRRLARLARRLGKRPSELQATTGASKQREHEERDEDHETKLARRRQGKQASALWRLGRERGRWIICRQERNLWTESRS